MEQPPARIANHNLTDPTTCLLVSSTLQAVGLTGSGRCQSTTDAVCHYSVLHVASDEFIAAAAT